MGRMNIKQFREQYKPAGGSKLAPFYNEILELHKEGYSLSQIMGVALNGVQVSRSTLHGFIKKSVLLRLLKPAR